MRQSLALAAAAAASGDSTKVNVVLNYILTLID